MIKKSRIVFFGNERLSTASTTDAPVLRVLIDQGYDIAAIVSHHSDGSGRKSRQLEIADLAESHKIPLLLPNKPADIADQLQQLQAEAAVLVAYGRIIPKAVIDIFPKGIINIHPSLLPIYRGPTPIEQAILDGAVQTGVSLMRLVPEMDAGPVYVQQKVGLSGKETKPQLTAELSKIGAELIANHLADILSGQLQAKPQVESAASYCQLISKADGLIDWNKPAAQLEREIRAYAAWPRSYSRIGNFDVIITSAHTAASENQTLKPGEIILGSDNLNVVTSEGILQIDRLQPAGKKEMSGADFINGYLKKSS